MDPSNPYFKQVELLVRILPFVAGHECFALKGGTALNLFVRDMPRLSVDIDLTYVRVNDREDAMAEIDSALRVLTEQLTQAMPGLRTTGSTLTRTNYLYKLVAQIGQTQVKIEISPVMRGVLNEPVVMETAQNVQAVFGYAQVPVVSFDDLYAGKLSAAFDRQHPRDLFDIAVLLRHEGLSRDLLDTFLVYLLCSNRPVAEMLSPNEPRLAQSFFDEFMGMTNEPITIEQLERARLQMVKQVNENLTATQKQFLLSFKQGEPDWGLLNRAGVERLPAIQWKLHNIRKMPKQKHKAALKKLENVLLG